MKKNKIIIILIISIAAVLSFSFTVYSFVKEIKKNNLPVLGQIHSFSLIDQEGKEFQSYKLRDKVWVADFVFTTCGNICPIMSKNMAALNRSFDGVDNVRLVSITVNPEFDSPQILKSYADKQNANDQWIFLTGSRQAITDIAVKSFKLGDINEPIFHSAYFSLVDQNGMIRGYYDGTKAEELNKLYKDAAYLVKGR